MNTSATSNSPQSSFSSAVTLATTYTLPFTMALVLISNIINICVLSRRNLRSSSCTHYFIASAVGTLLYLMSTPLNTFLSSAFAIVVYNNPFACRISPYIVYSLPMFITSMLVCASIDRYCSSSSSVRLRAFCQVSAARRVIIAIAIIIIIYISPILIVFSWNSNTYICVQNSTPSISAYLLSRVILYYILLPTALAIFGALTIYNIRNQTRRVVQMNQLNNNRRTEGQLARMLIVQVVIYLIFSTPPGVLYVMLNIVPSTNTPFFVSVRTITILWQQSNFFLAVFIYIISGTTYRQEMIKMFKSDRIGVQTQQNIVIPNLTLPGQTGMSNTLR